MKEKLSWSNRNNSIVELKVWKKKMKIYKELLSIKMKKSMNTKPKSMKNLLKYYKLVLKLRN
jgi:hypothetical protein